VLDLAIFIFSLVLCTNVCTKYCCKSLNKQSSGVQERINPFYIVSYGKNSFSLQTFRVTNGLQERIKFMNRGSTVLVMLTAVIKFCCNPVSSCGEEMSVDKSWQICALVMHFEHTKHKSA
jgi:hypothetical protein